MPTGELGFIGLGIMGLPMAGHLLKAGHKLCVYTRTKSKAEPLLGAGAKWASSAADAAKSAQIVFLCLPDTPDVQAVINEILPTIRAGQIVVDHSTISPSATRGMAEQLKSKGAALLDAPISGGDVGARNATLSIMVGGDVNAFAVVEPYLRLMGKTITHCGPSGAGQLTKLTNQILVTLNNLATCEALTFAMQNGLDGQKTLAALGGGAGSSWQFNNLGPRMLAGDFAPGFMIDLQLKDLRLVEQAASEAKLKLAAADLVHKLFQSAQQSGDGRAGTQALFRAVKKSSHAF